MWLIVSLCKQQEVKLHQLRIDRAARCLADSERTAFTLPILIVSFSPRLAVPSQDAPCDDGKTERLHREEHSQWTSLGWAAAQRHKALQWASLLTRWTSLQQHTAPMLMVSSRLWCFRRIDLLNLRQAGNALAGSQPATKYSPKSTVKSVYI